MKNEKDKWKMICSCLLTNGIRTRIFPISVNRGMYIAITIEPMLTPRKPIRSGSTMSAGWRLPHHFLLVESASSQACCRERRSVRDTIICPHVWEDTGCFQWFTKLSPRSTPVRTFRIASSMITLPEVLAVMSRDCKLAHLKRAGG